MDNSITFRFAQPADAVMLADMRLEMRRERETVPPPADQNAFEKANLEFFTSALAGGSYVGIIAEKDGIPVGNGGICFHLHPPSYSVPNGKSACLLNMYTLPDCRGRGAAGKILAFLVEKARELDCCKVYLNASDMGKPLYVKFGFTDVSGEMVFDLK